MSQRTFDSHLNSIVKHVGDMGKERMGVGEDRQGKHGVINHVGSILKHFFAKIIVRLMCSEGK